jgi:hypothetical protein
MPGATDRQLLFGLLALQNGIINQVQLVAAFQAWTMEKSRSLLLVMDLDFPREPIAPTR